MPRKKQPIIEQKELSEDQKKNLIALGNRIEAKNRYKLQKNNKGEGFEARETDSGLAILQAMEATGMADQDAAIRLLGQLVSTLPNKDSILNANAAVAMVQGIGPQDELEGMLAAQMVATHNLAMEYARRSMGKDLSVEVFKTLNSQTAKFMGLFSRQVEALAKYRLRGQQRITVQHVQVNQGGQAVIGDIHPGGARP